MLFLKVLASWTTALDTKLFAIRLDIVKTTSMDIEHIILITDFLSFSRKTVDLFVHFKQAHSLTVCSMLRFRLFLSCGLNYRIKFWNCLNNTK